jgi:hypothetical protein
VAAPGRTGLSVAAVTVPPMSNETSGDGSHGVALTVRVIETVRRDPGASALEYQQVPWVAGGIPTPVDEARLAGLAFPSGRPLSPSLRTWLAFDSTLLERYGWFDADGGLSPRPIDELARAELGEMWGKEFAPLADRFPECFLLPGGSDSRRVLAVTEPDELGEYPVLALDVDDLPFAGLMYPGFDVYLADTAGFVGWEMDSYTELIGHPVYGLRMRRHAATAFAGDAYAEWPF